MTSLRLARSRALMLAAPVAVALLTAAAAAQGVGGGGAGAATVVVSPAGSVRSIGQALRLVRSGGTVVIRAGVYREPTIVVDRPVTLRGEGLPTLDGSGTHQILSVVADDVTVTGLRFAHTGDSQMEDRAALKVTQARGCRIEGNRFDDNFFGIYLAGVADCTIRGNILRGATRTEEFTGNGIHLWSSRDVLIEGNRISGHRDGIYFEFANQATARGNVSEGNLRYGLHFMFSDDCHYLDNTFRRNGAGVAVMYTKRVEMRGNRFEDNLGTAAYGLLLKEILEPVLVENVFRGNTVGLFVDGATRIQARRNHFEGNGWAVKLMANTSEGDFSFNDFIGNSFDVATNSRGSDTKFASNYYDEYRGYDLDRDGYGDVPHHPVRLFSLIIEQNEPALILLRSLFVSLLDRAEQVLPALTPATLADAHPRMRRAR
jgi:nitrous oxidase accessory protein